MRLKRGSRSGGQHGTYQEWAEYLDLWGRNEPTDSSAPGPLYPDDFAGDTLERLVNRIFDAINQRLQTWQGTLSRSTDAAFGDEFEFGRALQQGRDGLHPIRALAADERFPEELRTRLTENVDNQIRQIQKQLEDNTLRQRDRGDSARFVEARLLTLRSNALTAVITQAQQGAASWNAPPDGVPRKRIIQR
jgi:hypothetical protein